MERKTKGKCKACGGPIVEKIESEPTMSKELIPIGPGSAKYFRQVSKGFYCKKCGIKYEFIIED